MTVSRSRWAPRPGRVAWLGVLALAACHHAAPPPPPPAPVAITGARSTTDSLYTHDSLQVAQAVTSEAVQLFGDSTPPPAPDSASAADSDADASPTWDIDVRSYETQQRVEYFVNRYENDAHDRFALWLSRSGRYEPMIRAKLRAAGLPEDLTYLALIESGYDPQAYSRAAAVGLWQLMTSTARGTGLRVDWWVDERRDPVRSTEGAIKFLRYLNEQFGSLYLAAAAYNGGPGRISRGLVRYADELDGRSGDDAFFALAETDYLKAETRDYVPRLIAAALIAKDPSRYGFAISYDSAFAYDSVRVGPETPLDAVAKAADTTVRAIMDLNPELLRGVTPPRESFTVRVPVGHADGFAAAFAKVPHADKVAFTRAHARRGQTVYTMARKAHVTTKELLWYNPGLSRSHRRRLRPGEEVLLPTRAAVIGARDVPDPAIERYGSSGRVLTHVVKSGESLGLIARRYHTTVKSIMRRNGLRKSLIFPGQVLVIRGRRARTRMVYAHRRRETRHASASGKVHVVRPGETLTSIARDYDTTVKRLMHLNGLADDRLMAGQKLVVGS